MEERGDNGPAVLRGYLLVIVLLIIIIIDIVLWVDISIWKVRHL